MTDTHGGLPNAVLEKTGEGNIRATLEALLVRKQRFPTACAEQLPVRVTQTEGGGRMIEIPYLVTTRMGSGEPGWVSCYDIMPWEDRRSEADVERISDLAAQLVNDSLQSATASGLTPEQLLHRRRLGVLFSGEGWSWRPELATERWTVLDQAGLPETDGAASGDGSLGRPFRGWLASTLCHLRRPLKSLSLPVELMPDRFTIPQFQAAAEGVLGQVLDKQVFRRNAINCGFLEDTGGHSDEIVGRPAKLFRFKIDVAVARSMQSVPLVLPLAGDLARYETIETLLSPVVTGPEKPDGIQRSAPRTENDD
ncbi:NrtR DNA-binding winged helix domain-containing protein [Acetobacter fallax]|uniref:NrtR DNA-binding winged helix domain-containing protein n=1 Tax=Acetobacter fallax TaxID=1737473 RepID=UPI00156AD095|nr:hypothetical protein [Acetobacter fallax]